jgi:hypothetical protein
MQVRPARIDDCEWLGHLVFLLEDDGEPISLRSSLIMARLFPNR